MLRWPVAIVSVLLLPAVLLAWVDLIPKLIRHPIAMLALGAGVALYWFAWRPASRRWGIDTWFVTSETRLTRAAARWLTRCPKSESNWFVTITPYFFPTAALLLAMVAAFIPIPLVPWSSFALGFAMAYHARAVRVVFRRERDELKGLGWVWICLFLPTAFLLCVGLLFAIAVGGWEVAQTFIVAAWNGIWPFDG